MKSKTFAEIMLTLLLIGTLTFAFDIQTVKAGSKTWYVDDDGGADFKIIQDAINAASPADTIVVLRGYYTESQVRVNETLTLIAIGKVIVDGLQQGRWVFCDNFRRHRS